MYDDMYNMKLNESRRIDNLNAEIIRVPGGWIYHFFFDVASSVFVPFDNEFMGS